MRNPEKIKNELKKAYIDYIDTNIPMPNESYREERRALLEKDNVLIRSPIIEIVKNYGSEDDKDIKDICDEAGIPDDLGNDISDFLNSGLLKLPSGEKRKLYRHQKEAFLSVFKEKKNLVVSTGTGSGKTECFLIPLFANFIKESKNWGKQKKEVMRSMILYPLNALAEDQMVRLRKALDSDDVKNWLDNNRNGQRITFGRYTSNTPKNNGELAEARRTWDEVKNNDKLKFQYPNMEKGSAEKKCRTEMNGLDYGRLPQADPEGFRKIAQPNLAEANPPDILITNYSMLDIMLMRSDEECIFTKTREWLEESPDNIFTLVVDELHTYRGTAGTEVSYIIKVLLDRLGLKPNSPQVRFLASSASLDASDETDKNLKKKKIDISKEFVRDFFGIEEFDNNFVWVRDMPAKKCQEPAGQFPTELVFEYSSEKDIVKLPKDFNPVEWLKYIVQDDYGNYNTLSINEIADLLKNHNLANDDNKVQVAENLITIINDYKDSADNTVQRIRGHYFARNIERIWVCSNPDCDQVDDSLRNGNRKFGKLYRNSLTRCACGAKVYEAVTCRSCGEIFLAGYKGNVIEREAGLGRIAVGYPLTQFLPLAHRNSFENDKQTFVYRPSKNNDGEYFEPGEVNNNQYRPGQNMRGPTRWYKFYFNSFNGIYKYNPEGENDSLVYVYANDNAKSPYPEYCPNCGTYKPYVESFRNIQPIINHGTGVQKVNQVFADQLMKIQRKEQENQAEHKNPKLVLFSDSRLSAAKLSAGIEQDHFRDSLRVATRNALNQGRDRAFLYLQSKYNQLKNGENVNLNDFDDEIRNLIQTNEVYRTKYGLLTQYIFITDVQKRDLDIYFTAQDNHFDINTTISSVEHTMLESGQNPGGIANSTFEIPIGRNKAGQEVTESHQWYEYVNWVNKTFENPFSENQHKQAHESKLNEFHNISVKKEILRIAFNNNKSSFEALGLGYFSASLGNNFGLDEEKKQLVNSAIRILGESWRVDGETASTVPERLRKYLNTYRGNVPYNRIKDNLYNLMENDLQIINDGRLSGSNLTFNKPLENSHYYICPICNTVHLHKSNNICVTCFHVGLEEQPIAELIERQRNNYFLATDEVTRLHCEELTGQTDKADSPRRQRLFQDILTKDDNELIDPIDLLSVTTTMEAGVDIGDLNVVMLGNVPPKRFNYQQRVGRAGRRNSPLSIALTVARVNSHDQTYYESPLNMVNGDQSMPYIDLNSETIARRVVAKEVLHKAFKECQDKLIVRVNNRYDQTHGEFGLAMDWNLNRPFIAEWIENNSDKISSISSLISDKYKDSLVQYIKNSFINSIDNLLNEKTYDQDSLAERMAASGLLPMFGFPTQVRNLFLGLPTGGPFNVSTVDRDMDMALASYTPGCEIIKDKKIYKSIGYVAGFKSVANANGRGNHFEGKTEPLVTKKLNDMEASLCQCPQCGYTTLSTETDNDCPICRHELNIFNHVKTALGYYADGRGQPYDGRFDWKQNTTETALDIRATNIELQPVDGINCECGFVEDGTVYSINTNNGKGYHVVNTRIPNLLRENEAAANNVDTGFALITTKQTGVLEVVLNNNNPLIDLSYADLDTNNRRKEVIRGAFLSWGYLLRKNIALHLAIDEDRELTLDFFSTLVNEDDERSSPGIYMIEQLQNGAGYTNKIGNLTSEEKKAWLCDELLNRDNGIYKNLIAHESACDTSCYDCLRNYYNQMSHSILNWRLALDLVHISGDKDYVPTYLNEYWKPLIERRLSSYKNEQNKLSIDVSYRLISDEQAYVLTVRGLNYLLIHPFWSWEKIKELSHGENVTGYILITDFITDLDTVDQASPYVITFDDANEGINENNLAGNVVRNSETGNNERDCTELEERRDYHGENWDDIFQGLRASSQPAEVSFYKSIISGLDNKPRPVSGSLTFRGYDELRPLTFPYLWKEAKIILFKMVQRNRITDEYRELLTNSGWQFYFTDEIDRVNNLLNNL